LSSAQITLSEIARVPRIEIGRSVTRTHSLEGLVQRAAVAAVEIAEDGDLGGIGRAAIRWRHWPEGWQAHLLRGARQPKRPRCRLRVRRRTPGAVRFWRLGCSADQHIGIDGEQARGRQILMRLHVIDPPDDEVTGRGIDVEEVGAGLDLADARDWRNRPW
jgi:hypothetical protein